MYDGGLFRIDPGHSTVVKPNSSLASVNIPFTTGISKESAGHQDVDNMVPLSTNSSTEFVGQFNGSDPFEHIDCSIGNEGINDMEMSSESEFPEAMENHNGDRDDNTSGHEHASELDTSMLERRRGIPSDNARDESADDNYTMILRYEGALDG
ncbi:hypothetical protein ACN47E_007676 [Coniothyrium glycines]